MSFSLWRSADAMRILQSSPQGHLASVATVRQSQPDRGDRCATASFSPYRTTGTWNGRDPLAGLVSTEAPADAPPA
jgi:hypothetical protein